MEIYIVEREYGDFEDKILTKLHVGVDKAKALEIAEAAEYPALMAEGFKDSSPCTVYFSVWREGKAVSEYMRDVWQKGKGIWERNSGENMDNDFSY